MKRILSLGLVLTMLCALMTFMPANAATIVASGECGTSVTWALDDLGTLTISGTGEMSDYSKVWGYADKYPWFEYKDAIKQLVVSEGVTSIDEFAFNGYSNLGIVSLPESLEKIEKQAFADCLNLNYIALPSNLKEIGAMAFENTGYYNNSIWENGVLYFDNYLINTKLNEVPNGYSIRQGTTLVAASSFFSPFPNQTLRSIEIPNSVMYINSDAFSNCAELTDVKMSDNIKIIDGFNYCGKLNNINLPNGIISIGGFKNCDGLTKITIPNSVTAINGFDDCDGLTEITIPSSVTVISGFNKCDGFTEITIPNSVTTINGFNNCTKLSNVIIPNSVTSLGGFVDCNSLLSITIPNSVMILLGFRGCENLNNIVIPNGVKYMGDKYDNAPPFTQCINLKQITIPDSVIYIGDIVFALTGITDVYYSGSETQWDNIVSDMFLIDKNDPFYGIHDDLVIHDFRRFLNNAAIHYNYNSPLFDVQQSANVTVDGKKLSFDQQPLMIDDRVLVPARAVFEALGASVNWDESAQTVTAVKGGNTVSLVIDSDRMYVNGQVKTLDVPAMVINDRTLVPARAVSEAFGCSVKWDEVYSTVIVEGK